MIRNVFAFIGEFALVWAAAGFAGSFLAWQVRRIRRATSTPTRTASQTPRDL